MTIVFFEMEAWEEAAFDALQTDHDVRFTSVPLTPETAADHADAEVVSTFIHSDAGAETLAKLPKLKLIATRSTGFNHIDLDTCGERGIRVANVPTYGDNTVAEHVFALLLAISHHIVAAADRTRRGDFSQAGLQGFDLRGKTFGVIGTGSIGRRTIQIARGFGMRVLAYDPKPDEDAAVDLGYTYVEKDELLARSDIISLHVPLNRHTHHLLGEAEFATMKAGVVIINTARGAVIDADALLKALAEGKVRAAGLDVLSEEPSMREEAELLRSYFRREHNLESLLADHILLRMKNVIITPHSAFNTREAVMRILQTTRENIAAFAAGQPLNVVNV